MAHGEGDEEMNIRIDQLADTISDMLQKYSEEVSKGLAETKEEVARDAFKKVKSLAPTRTKRYKKAISIIKDEYGNWHVYVKKPHYRLTHLLEHGHAKRSGGRTKAEPHWGPADEIVQTLPEKFKRRLGKW